MVILGLFWQNGLSASPVVKTFIYYHEERFRCKKENKQKKESNRENAVENRFVSGKHVCFGMQQTRDVACCNPLRGGWSIVGDYSAREVKDKNAGLIEKIKAGKAVSIGDDEKAVIIRNVGLRFDENGKWIRRSGH